MFYEDQSKKPKMIINKVVNDSHFMKCQLKENVKRNNKQESCQLLNFHFNN